jgi:hypothetical protein
MDIRYLQKVYGLTTKKNRIQRRPAMSGVSIAPYFPFRRIKIINQSVLADASEARIQVKPDKRFQPVCHFCGQKASGVHSWSQRTVRDLNLATAKVWITCQYRKLFCPHCQHISIEGLQASWPELENGQKHRQILFRGPVRTTQFRWATYFGRGRNIGQKRPSLPDGSHGLPQRPGGVCRQRPQSQNFKAFFQPNDRRPAQIH